MLWICVGVSARACVWARLPLNVNSLTDHKVTILLCTQLMSG